jgi:hypothetical protein
MKKQVVFFTGLALAATVAAGYTAPLVSSQVPTRADAPVLFAPRGWKIEQQINGHLNGDKVWDAALVLVENPAAKKPDAPRNRVLVVLLREGKGWRRAGFNNSLLLGTRDGGAFYGVVETPVGVTIEKGVLLVGQESGSREMLNTTHKFRFDARLNRFVLIGSDIIEHDRLTGSVENTSTNYLTGQQMTTSMAGESEKIVRVRSRVSRKLRPLEAIKGDERWAG